MNHTFNIEYAVSYGVNEAILLENLIHWIIKNRANGKHNYTVVINKIPVQRTFTYNSVKAFAEIFPYMTEDVIRRCLEKLRKLKILHKESLNINAYDRTSWYCFVDEEAYCGDAKSIWQKTQMVMAENTNGNGESAKSLYRYKPDNKPDIKEKSEVPKNKDEQEILVLIEKDILEKNSSLPGNYSLKNQKELKDLLSKYPIAEFRKAIPRVAKHPNFGARYSYGGYLTYLEEILYSEQKKEAPVVNKLFTKPRDGEYDGNAHSKMSFAENSA